MRDSTTIIDQPTADVSTTVDSSTVDREAVPMAGPASTPTSGKETIGQRGLLPVGRLLERARIRLGFSVATVARDVWISEQDLDRFEAGLRTPSDEVVRELARYYGIDPEVLTPEGRRTSEVAFGNDGRPLRLRIGWATVDLSRADGTNPSVLRPLALALRDMRQTADGEPLWIRDDEISVIAQVLDVDNEFLVADLGRWLCLSPETATSLARDLRKAGERSD